MIAVKHRRATADLWEAIDPIIPDGEIALTKTDSGVEVRIGDGTNKYSELLPINGRRIVNSDDYVNVTLRNGDEIQCGCIEALEITLNRNGRFFSAILSFETGSERYINATINYDGDILFSGDDLDEGYFSPCESSHYTMHFWYDGRMNCHVRAFYVG